MDTMKVSYFDEIQMMMFGFGDSHTPNKETVKLVESIVHSQLQLILQESLKYCRDGNMFTGEELVFLMRKNKQKMWRFIKYLQVKVLKKTIDSNKNDLIETVELTETPDHELMHFIEKIDETGELLNFTEFDEVKYQRMLRADRMSMALDEEKYLKYAKARSASFLHNGKNILGGKVEKLRLWIDPEGKFSFSPNALDVLTYYAYETVAQLIDYAFLVRLDTKRNNDPLQNLSGLFFNPSMFNGEHKFSGDKPDKSKVYSGQLPFSPNEISEVMRRIYSSQTGKFMLGTKVPNTHYILAL